MFDKPKKQTKNQHFINKINIININNYEKINHLECNFYIERYKVILHIQNNLYAVFTAIGNTYEILVNFS